MEETEVPLRNPMDIQSQIQSALEFQKKRKSRKEVINTRHISSFAAGFSIDCGNRLIVGYGQRSIGFCAEPAPREPGQIFRAAVTRISSNSD